MNVIIDTSAWSLALRRRVPDAAVSSEIARLAKSGRVQMLGVVRQELLSGIKTQARFDALRLELSQFLDLRVSTSDHERAAECYNACQRRGVQSTAIDMLICAMALRYEMAIYALDEDFGRYASILDVRLHEPFATR